jgi:hypothetical protein
VADAVVATILILACFALLPSGIRLWRERPNRVERHRVEYRRRSLQWARSGPIPITSEVLCLEAVERVFWSRHHPDQLITVTCVVAVVLLLVIAGVVGGLLRIRV